MSCNDIPSLLDLQKAKLNADDFGRLMGTGTGTSTNEFTGQVRPTYNKVINDMNSEFDGMIVGMNSEFDAQILNMGFTRVGTFLSGATLNNPRQTLLWDIADGGDGQEYGWSGAFPLTGKVVPPGSTPLTTGGIAVGAWMSRFDPELRIQVREALRRSYAEAGYNVVGVFSLGFTLNSATDVGINEADGKAYSGAGPFPQTVAAGTNPTGGGFTDRSSALLKAKLAANDGSKSVGYRYSDVYGALSRTLSSSDVGRPRPPLGYDPTGDVTIGQQQAALDTDVMARGGLSLAKKFRGIRRNMTALSLRGGVSSTPADDDFAPQITGVSNARGLAAYGSLDGVTAYVDAYVGPREAWETVASATYTANTCTISDAAVAAKIMIGDVLKTSHATPAWGIVTGITGTTITVDEWATDGTTVITPVPGTGFVINPIFKAWGLNLNVALLAGSQATTAVAAEIGVINHSQSVSASFPNGMDLVMLPSTYGGGAAYLARAVKTSSWQTGYNAQGCLFNFFSADGLPGSSAVHAGFMERSNAVIGMKFYNKNTYSMAWSKNDSFVDVSGADTTMALGPGGQALRKYDAYQVISADKQLSSLVPTYLVSVAGGITITMPPKASMQAGHYYKLYFINAGTFSITGDVLVNNSETLSLTVAERSAYTIIYDGNKWHIFS